MKDAYSLVFHKTVFYAPVSERGGSHSPSRHCNTV